MKKERKFQNVPIIWYIVLPLIGIIHKVLEMFGWLEQGGWPNFLLLLAVLFLWIMIVLRETGYPFSPLVWIGSIYGILAAITQLIFWINFRDPLIIENPQWSFDDLLTAITYYLIPGFRFLGNIMLGVLLGVFAGFTARVIHNLQRKRR